MTVAYCTVAIHDAYRRRARALCADLPDVPWVVLTDEPEDFRDLPVRAIRHAPTGPMAIDYLRRPATAGGGRASAAYHDKRFAIETALRDFDATVFLDADSRVTLNPRLALPPGLSVLPRIPETVADHLRAYGSWRLPFFAELARELLGNDVALETAHWCYEHCYAVAKDGRERRFLDAWGRAAEHLQRREVYSGEGGVMGLAAAYAGWTVDYWAMAPMAIVLQHEGGGPKLD